VEKDLARLSKLRTLLKSRYPNVVRFWRYLRTIHFRFISSQKVFASIYKHNTWGGSESRSGTGSGLAQTEEIRRTLPIIIKQFDCHSILDIPCGDFAWMKFVNIGIPYIGADIVKEIIDQNQTKYGCDSRTFLHLDITGDLLPTVDLVLCRDCLVHLSFADIYSSLRKLKASGSKYLLTTTFLGRKYNYDIPTGAWRPINLYLEPFSFPEPLKLIDERCPLSEWSDKHLALWRLADIALVE
jgi:hypothetical protein